MRVLEFQVFNYKSFKDSGTISIDEHFNVIVGANNVGKTALLEALSQDFENRPHRSKEMAPRHTTSITSPSKVRVKAELTRDELTDYLSITESHCLTVLNGDDPRSDVEKLNSAFQNSQTWTADWTIESGRIVKAELHASNGTRFPVRTSSAAQTIRFSLGPSLDEIVPGKIDDYSTDFDQQFSFELIHYLSRSAYLFSAQRQNLGQAPYAGTGILTHDASNLPQVLNKLQGNHGLFDRLNREIRLVLPNIDHISVDSDTELAIKVWGVGTPSDRIDLAVPLRDSGTGVGQVVAILYVAVFEQSPKLILIDEPQTFLHPGAARQLIQRLRALPTPHQFVVSTHAPTVIDAARPANILLVTKEQTESRVRVVRSDQAEDLKLTLHSIGARLEDLFGASNVIWVEGRTEEVCFTRIAQAMRGSDAGSVRILGVLDTGSFEKKTAATTVSVYTKLSSQPSPIPKAVAFIFDRENRTARERDDLTRQTKGLAEFLPRKMYENYLLSPDAIASVLQTEVAFYEITNNKAISRSTVKNWILRHGRQRHYEASSTGDFRNRAVHQQWLETVHGAKLLEDLFKHFTKKSLSYDKVRHGAKLTDWLIENSPDDLSDIAETIDRAFERASIPAWSLASDSGSTL